MELQVSDHRFKFSYTGCEWLVAIGLDWFDFHFDLPFGFVPLFAPMGGSANHTFDHQQRGK